jgi:hypothetical protein
LAVALAWKKTNFVGKYRHVMMKYTMATGDVSVVAATGLKIIYGYTVSPAKVAAGAPTLATVADGTITITTGNPLADSYVFVTAWGL